MKMVGVEIKLDENGLLCADFGHDIRWQVEIAPVKGVYKDKAREELGEAPERVRNALAEMRRLILADEYLQVPLDSYYLLGFLRPCKYRVNHAFTHLVRYYKFKAKHRDFCGDIRPATVRHVFKADVFQALPRRDQHGRRILLMRCSDKWDPGKCTVLDGFKALIMSCEIALAEPMTQVNGVVVIADFAGFNFSKAIHFSPGFIHMAAKWIQKCMPLRQKGIHVINNSSVFTAMYNLAMKFVAKKYQQRIFVHGHNLESLHRFIDPSCLPRSYGGTMQIDHWDWDLLMDALSLYDDDFKLILSYGYRADGKPADRKCFESARPKIRSISMRMTDEWLEEFLNE